MSTFKKPLAGDPANLILSESFQGALVDVVNAYNRGELTKKPQDLRKQNVVMVKNETENDIEPGQALSVDQTLPSVGSGLLVSYLNNPLVYGSELEWHTNIAEFAIATQTILAGQIGPAAFKDWGRVKANTASESDGDWLMHDPDDPKQFKRSTGGIAKVITADATTGECLANFDEQQRFWRYELTEDVSNLVGVGDLIDLDGNVYASNTNFRFTSNEQKIGTKGFCLHTGNNFDAVEAVNEEQTPRIRFQLKTSFDDTGVAQAYVLDTFGNVTKNDGSPVRLFDILTVHDPRKCFAHAVGEDDLLHILAEVDPFFYTGGSVGYAVKTKQLKLSPESPTEDFYPRWEVEQCTQIVDKMKVRIYSVHDPSGGNTTQPTGEFGESSKTLFFNADEAIVSRWPYVDFAPEWTASTNPDYDWEIECENPHKFSAGQGWAIIERVVSRSRVEDATNIYTPYSANTEASVEWHIVDVQNPIARWLQVEALGAEINPTWLYAQGDVAEGRPPNSVSYRFNDNGSINDHIRTAPGLKTGCLNEGEIGWAFWDPNAQFYNVISTESALLGQPTGISPVIDASFAGCDLVYTKLQGVQVFGGKQRCEFVQSPILTSPQLVSVDVVTSVSIDPEFPTQLCFGTGQVYVCDSLIDPSPTCYDICNPCYPPPEGCCEYPPGTYTNGVTFDACEAQGGNWTPGECPTECPVCDLCATPGGGVNLNLQQFSFASGGVVVQGGTFNIQTTVQTGSCTATVTGFFTPVGGGAQTPASCEMTLVADALSPSGFAIDCVWSPAQVYNCTLDATLFGSFPGVDPCADSYGLASGGVDPANPPEGNSWTDYQVDTNPCIP